MACGQGSQPLEGSHKLSTRCNHRWRRADPMSAHRVGMYRGPVRGVQEEEEGRAALSEMLFVLEDLSRTLLSTCSHPPSS